MAQLDSLTNYLSKNINFIEIGQIILRYKDLKLGDHAPFSEKRKYLAC